MSNANLTLIALLVLLTTNGNITSTQLFLLLALLTTTNCICQNNYSESNS